MLPTDAPTYVCTYLYSLPTEEAHALPTSSCTDHLLQYDSACTNKADRSNQWSYYSRPNEIKNQSHATSVGWFEGCSQETLYGQLLFTQEAGKDSMGILLPNYSFSHDPLVRTSPRFTVIQMFRWLYSHLHQWMYSEWPFQCCPLHTLWALNSILNMVPNTGCPNNWQLEGFMAIFYSDANFTSVKMP